MQDLCSGSLTLERFKAVVFVGGFSYADVLGSAKGSLFVYLHICIKIQQKFKKIIKLLTLCRRGLKPKMAYKDASLYIYIYVFCNSILLS